MRFFSFLAVALSPMYIPLCAAFCQAKSNQTQIDYTGSLYGYYRMEYGEDPVELAPVKDFLDSRSEPAQRDTLLLGMGDNFGPEFGASLQLEDKPATSPCYLDVVRQEDGETRPESLYKDDNRIAQLAECDNVLNFMMHAGYRAVVPGLQDFMYTARWLRGAGRLLADTSDGKQGPPLIKLSDGSEGSPLIENPDGKLYLLAANVRITMKGKLRLADKTDPKRAYSLDGRCPLLFAENPFAEDTVRCVGDSSEPEAEPLDWLARLDRLRRLEAGGAENPTVAALVQLATQSEAQAAGRDVDLSALVSDEISIMQSAWGLRFPRFPFPVVAAGGGAKDGSPGMTWQEAKKLADGLSANTMCGSAGKSGDLFDLCTYASRLKQILNDLSTSLQGAKLPGADFVLTETERGAAVNGLLRTVADEEKNVGYTMARDANGRRILVIGVVGEDIMNEVSETNRRMCIGGTTGNGKTNSWPDEARKIKTVWPDDFGSCYERFSWQNPQNGLLARVVVTDPVEVTSALVRGAELEYGPVDNVVVMAQMPHAEAEDLAQRVWRELTLANAKQQVDVVLSEADTNYETPNMTLQYPASGPIAHAAPVLTPVNSYSSLKGTYSGAISRLTLQSAPGQEYSLTNQPKVFSPPNPRGTETTVSLLYKLIDELIDKLQGPKTPAQPQASPPTAVPNGSNAELELLKALQQGATPKADVVLLQSRDLELGRIGDKYDQYSMCDDDPNQDLCKLRAALDRIFWKGDYLAYVAVQGKDLTALLNSSQNLMAQHAQLADTGISREWLVSYGVVQSTLVNLTEISENDEPLWIPVDPSCKSDSKGQSTYCVDGTPIVSDAYYWLLTTDQLAQDKEVYGTLQKLPAANRRTSDKFITAAVSEYLFKSLGNARAAALTASVPKDFPERLVTTENERFQQRSLLQVDFAKVIASFTSREPVGGNQFVADFQGVSDPRASAPGQQQLDLEMGARVTRNLFGPSALAPANATPSRFLPLSAGVQSSFAYDRNVLGNLLSKPINASYPLNDFTVGGFLQLRIFGKRGADTLRPVRSLPRDLLVFTPHQYQVEINTPYLFFPYTSPLAGELTVQLPRVAGWTDRAGFRREFGQSRQNSFFSVGSYFETGMELSEQDNVLSGLTLKTGSAQKSCGVSANLTLQTCFTNAHFTINATTTVVGLPDVKTLHSPGFYWDLYFQNRLFGREPGKQISLVTDTQGDFYFGRPAAAELPTQTEYAIPLSLSLSFPAFGNLAFAPSYSVFFYQSQLSNQSLQVNSLSIAARWYFARDARVPVRRQARLPGPESADQTKTGKAQ